MVKIGKIIILIFFTLITLANSQPYKFVRFSKERGAACLDGSEAGVYVHEGSGKNKNSFMIYFNGGGYCGASTLSDTLQSCYKRSFTTLGSTANISNQRSFDNQGILSTLPENNPYFYDWTLAYVIYCDGSEHQGSRTQPIQYKGRNLYFRGTNNTLETFRYLNETYDFYNKDRIVITGVSAGGIATYFWSNYLFENTKSSQVYALPDSGIFLIDFYNPISKKQVLRQNATPLITQITNVEIDPPVPECLKYGDVISCFDVTNMAKYIKAPMLIIQSVYDAWPIVYILQLKSCLSNSKQPFSIANCNQTQRELIEKYRVQVEKSIQILKGSRKDVGVWSPACVQHGFSDSPSFKNSNFKVPSGNGIQLYEAIEEFLRNPYDAKQHIDLEKWPCNRGCSGLTRINLQIQ